MELKISTVASSALCGWSPTNCRHNEWCLPFLQQNLDKSPTIHVQSRRHNHLHWRSKDATLALIFTVVPCTAYEDSSVLTGLVALALISDLMPWWPGICSKLACVYLHPGVYFTGENTIIVSQSTNNMVIFLLLKLNFWWKVWKP